LPGLVAAYSGGARLIYHEHDSPSDENAYNHTVRWARRNAARKAELVIFPNDGRGRIAQERIGFSADALRIVWNLPCLDELPSLAFKADAPIVVYYHGSVTPERLPKAVPEAVARFDGAVLLEIAGYEAPTGQGYVARLQKQWGRAEYGGLIRWVGALPTRRELLARAAQAHIGLALMPSESGDVNMTLMAGASNKAFDYMAAGLALVVSDLPDWQAMFVKPGHAVPCDPGSANSVEGALRFLIENPNGRAMMAARARAKIEREWNYEAVFGPVIARLEKILPLEGTN
jgi:glycosyltransferase involved in cell wall biosynthesis